MSLIYLNGQFIAAENAMIPVTDRGLRFGDGAFDTMYFNKNTIYQEALHQKRLNHSLNALQITEIDIPHLFLQAHALIEKNQLPCGSLRITITRGSDSIGYLPAKNNTANIFIEIFAARPRSTTPLDLWISTHEKPSAAALPVHAKTLNSLSSVLARMEAETHNCPEALLLSSDHTICEGSSSNIFWFKNNILYTPALNCGILEGTMRNAVIRLSPYQVIEGQFTLDDLTHAQEAFLTNVNLHATPIGRVKPLNITYTQRTISDQIYTLIKQDIEADATTNIA